MISYQAAGYGESDRNGRCGHSRSLQRLLADQGVDANALSEAIKLLREVLADYSYRDHHASVQKVARNSKQTSTTKSIALRADSRPARSPKRLKISAHVGS